MTIYYMTPDGRAGAAIDKPVECDGHQRLLALLQRCYPGLEEVDRETYQAQENLFLALPPDPEETLLREEYYARGDIPPEDRL